MLLIDDHPAVRRGIKQLFSQQPDLAVIGEAGSAEATPDELACWAEGAVVGYHLGGRDGLWLTRRLRRCTCPPGVLIYSTFADQALALAAIIAGADGLLSKRTLDEELCIAIRRLARGRQHFPAVPASFSRALRARLEPRDQAIFDMLIHGLPTREVTARRGTTPAKLEARREAILRAIAPKTGRPRGPRPVHAPLDYQRPLRRPRYRAASGSD